jgi:hypothetical protein
MSDDAGGKSALSDGLGPLPEPYKKVRIVEDADYPIDLHLYSPEQMRAYATAAVAAERERCADAVRATPTHTWVDGSDQWGNPCPVKIVTAREQYAQACERA